MVRLNERHNNVANDINSNVKRFLKHFVSFIKNRHGEIIEDEYTEIKTDYDYIIACLQLASGAVIERNLNELVLFSTKFNVSIRNRSIELPITITIHNDDNQSISGGFSIDENENDPQIDLFVYAKSFENSSIEQCRVYVLKLVKTLSHELAHCYQYLSKENYEKGEARESQIPQGFSYIIYYIKQPEIEAECSAAYTYWKKRKKSLNYVNSLCRTIDFSLSPSDNDISDDELTPTYLQKKYTKNEEISNLFMLNYFLAEGIKNTRYYKLVANDESYKKAVNNIKNVDYKEMRSILNDIYDTIENKFEDPNFDTATAYWLVSSKKSLGLLLSSMEYALNVLDQVKANEFDSVVQADEEEDTIVHGREET